MKPSLIKKQVESPLGSVFHIGVRPYPSNQLSIVRRELYAMLEEDEYDRSEGIYNSDHWFYTILAKVMEIEFPKKSDFELQSFQEFWQNRNGDFRHTHGLFADVSENIAKLVIKAVEEVEEDYKSRLPKQPEIIREGEPSDKDPKDGKPGSKQLKKKS